MGSSRDGVLHADAAHRRPNEGPAYLAIKRSQTRAHRPLSLRPDIGISDPNERIPRRSLSPLERGGLSPPARPHDAVFGDTASASARPIRRGGGGGRPVPPPRLVRIGVRLLPGSGRGPNATPPPRSYPTRSASAFGCRRRGRARARPPSILAAADTPPSPDSGDRAAALDDLIGAMVGAAGGGSTATAAAVPSRDRDAVVEAYRLARRARGGGYDEGWTADPDRSPRFVRAAGTALIAASMRLDAPSVVAALLHGALIEDVGGG